MMLFAFNFSKIVINNEAFYTDRRRSINSRSMLITESNLVKIVLKVLKVLLD